MLLETLEARDKCVEGLRRVTLRCESELLLGSVGCFFRRES